MSDQYDNVWRSPLNSSPTKQLYSFPKAQRFNYLQKPYSEALYFPKNQQTQRTTTFGQSKRLDESPNKPSPSPNKYRIKTQFDRNVEQAKGYGFGREERMGSALEKQKGGDVPGPGAYAYKMDKYINLAFSMGSRHEDIKNVNPLAPGQYNIPSMNSTGEYFNSKYRNSGCGRMSKSPRFGNKVDKSPGPGSYQAGHSTDMSKQGSYFNSKFKSSGAQKFSRSDRSPARSRSRSPAPGSYQAFSQFGKRNKSTLRM